MFRLRKQFKFEAAHQLVGHDGKCARLHGHSWVGWIEVEGESLATRGPKEGMLVDFYDMGSTLKGLVELNLDHYFLNDTLRMDRPTSERVAEWVYHQLFPSLPELVAVFIEETCTSSAEYRP